MSLTAFYALAAFTLVFALFAVTTANMVRAAFSLAVTFFLIAGLYLLLGSPALAAVQFMVNASAIPIMTLFIIMMTQSRRSAAPRSWQVGVGFLAAAVALVFFRSAVVHGEGRVAPVSPEALGTNLLQAALLPFEVASVLLLLAMVGAIVLARRRAG
ncbi:MAG TPA: NADH-quinone oxidoreductase subunit J [Oceanithermus profundus]|uniref:NADH-quinone oxidoreductase subunit J n=1 Tax=Oceanithermus profundus TaxID=187137 RepID=A0A7C4VM72_9DEIN|nr:NADH-quinone oxidoreductase subunit J [Oceanithermus profundus]